MFIPEMLYDLNFWKGGAVRILKSINVTRNFDQLFDFGISISDFSDKWVKNKESGKVHISSTVSLWQQVCDVRLSRTY